MKKKHIYMSDLHFEHKTWKSELSFQGDELKFFKNRLEEVVPRYTDSDVLAKAEQLQNQMIRHHEVLDVMIHDINSKEHDLSSFAQDHPIGVDHVHFNDHSSLRERVDVQRNIYGDFKKNFFQFLVETM